MTTTTTVTQTKTPTVAQATVDSRAIKAIRHHRGSKTMDIEFADGSTYRFPRVPRSLFSRFVAAESKGTFFNDEVRGVFDGERVA
jgi:hypothetical protein